MRAKLHLGLMFVIACQPRVPDPQPPRTVCNGAVVPAGYAYAMSSTCYDLPADPCWNDDSEDCREVAEQRRKANHDADVRDRVGLILLAATAVFVIGVVIANP